MLLSNTNIQMESSDRKLLLTTGVELRRGGAFLLLILTVSLTNILEYNKKRTCFNVLFPNAAAIFSHLLDSTSS